MPAGRPSTLTQEVKDKAREYITTCVDEFGEDREGKPFVKKVNFPSHSGLSLYLKVNRTTLYDWADKDEEFANILDEILREQENRLVKHGLDSTYNSNIAKLVLGKHGYKEQTEQENTGEIKITTTNYASVSVPTEGVSTQLPEGDGQRDEASGA